jgi:hypothetical protein
MSVVSAAGTGQSTDLRPVRAGRYRAVVPAPDGHLLLRRQPAMSNVDHLATYLVAAPDATVADLLRALTGPPPDAPAVELRLLHSWVDIEHVLDYGVREDSIQWWIRESGDDPDAPQASHSNNDPISGRIADAAEVTIAETLGDRGHGLIAFPGGQEVSLMSGVAVLAADVARHDRVLAILQGKAIQGRVWPSGGLAAEKARTH